MRTARGTGAVLLEGTPAPWGGASQSGSGPINHQRPTRWEKLTQAVTPHRGMW